MIIKRAEENAFSALAAVFLPYVCPARGEGKTVGAGGRKIKGKGGLRR